MGNPAVYAEKLNPGEDDEMSITGYRFSFPKTILTCFAVLLSGGTLLILMSWKPSIRIKMTHSLCPFKQAEKVVLIDMYNQQYVEKVVRPEISTTSPTQTIYFYNKKIKYIWQQDFLHFVKLGGLDVESCEHVHSLARGLSSTEALLRLQLYGKNSILVEVKPIFKLIFQEIGSPFYMYQIFIVIVWMVQVYYQFSVCVVLLSTISITATVWETRKQSKALRNAVHSHSEVTVLRDGYEIQKSSHELVPGDVIFLPQHQCVMECDAILLSGTCVVSESMLTGESTPITKVPIAQDSNHPYSPLSNKRSTIFCGTEILHSCSSESSAVKALVYRTAKGELVRSILFPKPVQYKLYSELFKSMIIFLVLGIPAMVYTAIIWSHHGASAKNVVILVVDVATFVVPPLLPAVMTSINAHGQRRLRTHDIFCLNSGHINFAGGLDVVCFDKTGTLTEDNLDLAGIIPIQDVRFQHPFTPGSSHSLPSTLIHALATCHSLTVVDGRLMGYPVDIKMFNVVAWELEEPKADYHCSFERLPARIVRPKKKEAAFLRMSGMPVTDIAIVRQFPFESLLQRMSVITCKEGSDNFELYIKGAPEMVSSFCDSNTIPENFLDVLELYTRQGFRVLALGYRSLEPNITWDEIFRKPRDDLECNLKLVGLLVLQNKLKPESQPSLRILKKANIRTVMVTGDNLLTAISVARDCGMVDEEDSVISVEAELLKHGDSKSPRIRVNYSHVKLPGFSEKLAVGKNGIIEDACIPLVQHSPYHLAMDGKTFNLIKKYDQVLLQKVVHKGTIFARMLPEQKLHLIEVLQLQGHQVGMCGDGANDCGALKTAHAGVSLSVAEASVASPFTAKKQNIECIPTLIREGRATLAATFGAFRYMVCYCFILLSAVLILFWDGEKPSDGAYVLIDIILNLLPPIVFGGTAAYPYLVKKLPTRSILSFVMQFSMISYILLQIGVLIFARYFLLMQPWFEPTVYNKETTLHPPPSHMACTIISVNMMSYIIAAVIFAPGPPYRKHFFSNKTILRIFSSVFTQDILLSYYKIKMYPLFLYKQYLNIKCENMI
ncbi:probable cation-transporting ATPase 13A3 isoform X2 [Limulus polyphemus]|uniref:Cation-transporting ATPase n=1 Tax=Limulus polyphemus TaxID=6850 RepID=A0ABM1THB7_LIMPO|nr:probable cation-transporting ATPase 13A3 isoform X2 [Limulus polyphemus]